MKKAKKDESACLAFKLPTLLQAIDSVAQLSNDSQLSDEFFMKASPEIGLLADSYGITERQAVIFSVCLLHGPYRVDFGDLARHLDLSTIGVLSLANDIDMLVRRRLLRYRDAKDKDQFDIPRPVLNALKRNEPYESPTLIGLDKYQLFEVINEMFNDLEGGSLTPSNAVAELRTLFGNNRQVAFVQHLAELNIKDNDDWLLLVWMCNRQVGSDDDDIRLRELEDLYETRSTFNAQKSQLRQGEHSLMKCNLLEHKQVDGIADTSRIGLTSHAKRTLLADYDIRNTEACVSGLIKHTEVQRKSLFYSTTMEQQVAELESLLMPGKYDQVVNRMKKRGFRQGFACLFYGAAGTGKTETVYQLARHTGRDIMLVDVPQIKSKWVGDSEKNIKAVFDRYREAVKRSKLAPILLFNEADAVISTRKSGAENAVDKMENAIQNIILQEMESLEGIMIATTNLEQNFDSAFERRFLYKLRFERPTPETRARIWRTMIKGLNKRDSLQLAQKFDLSGGQIENVARKWTINDILFGSSGKRLDTLIDYCKAEQLARTATSPHIGFA